MDSLVLSLLFLLIVNIKISQEIIEPGGIKGESFADEEMFQNQKNIFKGYINGTDYQDKMIHEIIALFGKYKSSDASGNVCISGRFGSDFMLQKLVHCFNKREISNITVALYKLCSVKEKNSMDNSNSTKMKVLQKLTEEIANFRRTDYILLWKCLRELPTSINHEFEMIVKKLLESPFANYSLYNILDGLQSDDRVIVERNITIVNSDVVLSVWHPFETNITGIALYEDQNGTNPYWIKHIYGDDTLDDINLENLKIAGYIPNNFLNKLTENSTIDKRHLYVILVMIMNAEKYNGVLQVGEDLENYIGVAIPRFCKNNTEPMLRAFFKHPSNDTQDEWRDFGQDYFDSLQKYGGYTCILSFLSYFGRYSPDSQDKPAKIIPPCESFNYASPIESFFNQTIFQVILRHTTEQIQNITQPLYYETFMNLMEASSSNESTNVDLQSVLERELDAGLLKLKDRVKSIDENMEKKLPRVSETDLESLTLWIPFQRQWILQEWKRCFFNYIIKNFWYDVEATYFETVKETHCMEEVDFGIKWRQTPIFNFVYPEKFCLDRDLQLPSKFCYEGGVFANSYDEMAFHSECYEKHPISNKTATLFEILIDCENHWMKCEGYAFSPAALVQEAQNYVDVSLVLRILYKNNTYSVSPFLDAFEKGLQLVKVQAEGKRQMSYISAFLRYFTFRKSFNTPNGFLKRDNFIYLALNPVEDDIVGLVLYKRGRNTFKDYIIKSLVRENATEFHAQAEDVEVVIYLNSDDYMKSNISESVVDVFIIYNNHLTESDTYLRRTRLVGLYKDTNIESVKLTVFLKPVDNKSPEEGGWTTVSLSNSTLKMVSIIEPRHNVCDSTSKFSIFSVYLDKHKNSSENIGNTKSNKAKTGFLSQLVVSVNIETQEIHDKHSNILNTIMYSLAILSAIALVFIFVTLLMLKDWYRKRFYSIQLAIAVTCETVFFILDDEYINHIGYVLFYYSMLSQFAWMVIIGYIQYMKFVKIFKFSELGIWKSLVLGWVIPFVITLASVLFNSECLKCKLCSKNGDTFTYFVVVPVCVVILCNLVIYIVVIVNVARMKTHTFGPEARRAWLRAILILPFIMGISWIFILAFMTRWSWVNLMGSYLFHIIAPSQGLVLFVFIVALDQDTRKRWSNRFSSMK